MKKFIAIALIALLAAAAVFALDQGKKDEVVVKAKVGPISIQEALDKALENGDPDVLYSLFGSMSPADVNEKEVDTQIDLNDEAVIVYFRIYQNYKLRTNEDVTLEVTASKLYLDGVSSATATDNQKSADPTISGIETNSTPGDLDVTYNAASAASGKVTFTLDYNCVGTTTAPRTNVTIDPRDIATFRATWPKQDPNNKLDDGLYKATVVLQLTSWK